MDDQGIARLSYKALLVLRMFIDQPRKELCGADLIKVTRLSSGTLYPILIRFEKYGLLESYWECVNPGKIGRPRRRLYKLTSRGAQIARQAVGSITYPNIECPKAAELIPVHNG